MKQILVIGRHEQIMQTVLKLINEMENYHAIGCLTDKEAIDLLKKNSIDLVLVGGGVEIQSEMNLRTFVQDNYPFTKVIQHFGGGSGLLFNELREALGI
jgi:hypothetical protein